MSIKYYDTNGKYWGKFDETRGLFIPSEEVLADCKTEPQTEDEILHEQVRAFMSIVEQTERSE